MSNAAARQVPCNNGLAPTEEQGPRALLVTLSLTANITYTDDLTLENENGTINNVQAAFIDNSLNTGTLTLTMLDSGQVITIATLVQGYFPLVCHSQVKYTVLSTATATVKIIFLNVPMDPGSWVS